MIAREDADLRQQANPKRRRAWETTGSIPSSKFPVHAEPGVEIEGKPLKRILNGRRVLNRVRGGVEKLDRSR